jgi:diguanylate cyclase (GGDEF)-like protein
MFKKRKNPDHDTLPLTSNWQPAALPVLLVIVSAELLRHWGSPANWLYLFCAVLVGASWIGVLSGRETARQHAGSVINFVIIAFLLAGLFLSHASNNLAGREITTTLLFWAPAIVAWWTATYYSQPVRGILFCAVLYTGFFFADQSEHPDRHFHDYLILGLVTALLVRFVIHSCIEYFRLHAASHHEFDASMRDPITGAASRSSFEAELAHIAAVADRYRVPFSLIAINIDDYDQYAERSGEDAGNELLRGFSWLISDRIRKADTACRWEDAEFVILLPHTSTTGALKVVESIRNISTFTTLAGAPDTCCFGICEHKFGEDPMSTLEVAERALMQARLGGKNQLIVSDV